MSRLATMSEAASEYAANAGSERPEQAWILSPYDTWHPNPCYSGPKVPHPEDDYGYDDLDMRELEQAQRDHDASAAIDEQFLRGVGPADGDDDIPF